ncbi:hypothetical protein BDZ85DRAFT_21536 [Elsinoe ampelina]|uniref:Uncharacterized protein n=1 Tax=Elsinoe ampelina TaxID=302913 RepID=A0A6A6G5B1_9PEZI|nr:hypothetical protein BDZ85DRAFT_21536 [Elsinoe ampelina]
MRHGITALCVKPGTRLAGTCRTRMNQFYRGISSDHKLVSHSLSALCAMGPWATGGEPGRPSCMVCHGSSQATRIVPRTLTPCLHHGVGHNRGYLALANHDLKSIRSLFANSHGTCHYKDCDRQVAPCLLCRLSNDNVVVSLQPHSASMVRFPCGSHIVSF